MPRPPAPLPVARPAAVPGGMVERWRAAVEAVRVASARHGKSLAFGRLVRITDAEVVIAFTPEADFHRTTVSGAGRSVIEQVISERFGRPMKLVIDANAAKEAPPSIAEEELKERAAHERSVDHRVRHDSTLQSMLRIFGGEVEHIQILERERRTVAETEPSDDAN